jgi:hypothetical protein
MNGKRRFLFVFPAFFFFAAVQTLAAQDGGPAFRRLRWQPAEYASGYEVMVEILTASNEWVEQFRKTTGTETFVDCPLFIGKYRFRVSAFDLLGRPGSTTEWVYFELRVREPPPAAGQEQARWDSPAGPVQTKAPPWTEEAEKTETAVVQSGGRDSLETNAVLPEPLLPRTDEKSFFALELFYTPLITLVFSDFNEIYSTAPFQPVGFMVRFTAHPFKSSLWGLGLAPYWNFLASEIHLKSRYTHVMGGHIFSAWRIQPGGKDLYITIRAGGGLTYLSSRFDFNEGEDIEEHNAWNPSASLGVSLQSRLIGPLFLDAGTEYLHIFSQDNLVLNYLRPMLGIGWWF